ncbi:MAG: DsbC family protein [Thiothrix sp.]|uniref:DsbC family protein n=1 Tax=Thiothrix sp. TaxID=1032 RepID=UPI0026035EBA|nr:DsbC family protein [Thiothrix sp.]MDD5392766.1 DsbC family protein [Thiothrix sp.]
MYKKLILGVAISVALASVWAVAEEKKAEEAAPAVAAATAPAAAAPAAAAPAPTTTQTDSTVPADLAEKMKPIFGGAPDSLKATPVAGVFEAKFGGEMIYVSADAHYVFAGDLIDAQSKSNLTELSRSGDRKAVMGKIDASKSIEFKAKGEEKHVLYAFTDVDCPFCAKLHKEVPALNDKGVTVRYLAYPRAGVGSPTYKKMVSIWCADNKQEAMTNMKNGKDVPVKDCTNPVAEQFELGQKLGVNGTPALVTADGMMIPGFRPADQLVQMLDAEVKNKAK